MGDVILMTKIIKMSIRIFLIFTVFRFINSFILSINTIILLYRESSIYNANLNIVTFLPFILTWIFYITIVIVLWKNSNIIAKKIIEEDISENINITLNYKEALSLGIIILGIFLFFEPLPRLFSYIANFVTSKSRFVERDFLREYRIKEVIEMIGIGIKMFLSFLLIKNKNWIINKIENIGEKISKETL